MLPNSSLSENDKNTPWHLPGGVFIWIISLHEILLFFIGIIIYKYQYYQNSVFFNSQKLYLSFPLGMTYTILLLTSGWCIAESLKLYRSNQVNKGKIYHGIGIIFGLLFLLLKVYDFDQKINQGKRFGDDSFWSLYWFLNSFHFLHIFIGTFLLAYLFFKLPKPITKQSTEEFASLGIFWHACDIIWIVIFSTFYLSK